MALIRLILELIATFFAALVVMITFSTKFATSYYLFTGFGVDKLIAVALLALSVHALLGE